MNVSELKAKKVQAIKKYLELADSIGGNKERLAEKLYSRLRAIDYEDYKRKKDNFYSGWPK